MRIEITKRPHQPRLVSVVAAGMCMAGNAALPRLAGGVIHPKSVNVGAKGDCFSRPFSVNDDDDAALDEFGVDIFNSPAA